MFAFPLLLYKENFCHILLLLWNYSLFLCVISRGLLEPIIEFDKFQDEHTKWVFITFTNNSMAEKELVRSVPFTIVKKLNTVNKFIQGFKGSLLWLLETIEKINRRHQKSKIIYTHVLVDLISKMSMLQKIVYWCCAVLFQVPRTCFSDLDKSMLKLLWKYKKFQVANTILNNKKTKFEAP